MQTDFQENERLYRRIPDKPAFFHEDGTISSAVFKLGRENGVSVDRAQGRSAPECVKALIKAFSKSQDQSKVASISVADCHCNEINAAIKYVPRDDNPYHSEIHKSENEIKLTNTQCKFLALKARLEPIA